MSEILRKTSHKINIMSDVLGLKLRQNYENRPKKNEREAQKCRVGRKFLIVYPFFLGCSRKLLLFSLLEWNISGGLLSCDFNKANVKKEGLG